MIRAGWWKIGMAGAALALGVAAARPAPPPPGAPNPAAAVPEATVAGPPSPPPELPILDRWESFTTRDGLPDDHVFCVRRDAGRVWAGTARGLGLYEGGRWRRFGPEDGLPHRVVLSLDVNPTSGDVWIGTMAGLARYSAGRFDIYNQLNSGLPNDVVNGVRYNPEEDALWAATAMGAGRLDLRRGEWTIYTHENTPMHEPWTYSVAAGDGHVFVGAWGAGILDRTLATGEWREYRDPDKEFELDLFADDGPVSDVTSSIDYASGILWQASYVGLTRYDGREWRSFYAEDSGLAGNFVNFVRAAGPLAWLATDQGVSVTDGEDWVSYRRRPDGKGEIRRMARDGATRVRALPSAPIDNFVLGVDAGENEVWVATGRGVSRGWAGPKGAPGEWKDAPRFANPGAAQGLNRGASRFHYADTPDELQPYRGRIPYKDLFSERTLYRGPGREDPEPAEPESVAVGFIGPLEDKDNPVLPPGARAAVRNNPKAVFGRRMLQGASLAVQEANAAGGHHGRPFRIVPRTDLVLWGQTSNEMVRFAYEDRVWAVLSAIDSNHNHVLSRTTLKTEVPVVTGGSTDPTLVEHNIPWLVRAIQDDRQQAYALLHEIFRVRSFTRVALLRSGDRDGRTGVDEFMSGARRLGRPVVLEQRFDPGDRDFSEQLTRIRELAPEALILWGNAAETGIILRQARASGLALPIYGFDRMAGADFLQAAGPAAEGVTAVSTLNPDRDDPVWRDFRERYQSRWGEDPDTFAAHGYDAMNLILSAIQRGGLNRVRIRDELFSLRSVPGVTGTMVFDTNMSNVAPLWLAVVRNGRFHYAAAPLWTPTQTASGTRPGSDKP